MEAFELAVVLITNTAVFKCVLWFESHNRSGESETLIICDNTAAFRAALVQECH